MIERQGDMIKEWLALDDRRFTHLAITTNSTVTKAGKLVMGRGAAKQARDTFPGLDREFGDQILRGCGNGGFYGMLSTVDLSTRPFFAFQVKYHWSDEADFNLIAKSAELLASTAKTFSQVQFWLNYPGIGNGRLTKADVSPILDLADLPDNVTVWTLS